MIYQTVLIKSSSDQAVIISNPYWKFDDTNLDPLPSYHSSVTPAKAGVQVDGSCKNAGHAWIPAFAGMTVVIEPA